MADTLTVDIWTDLICPWCWIGERRFERALAAYPQRARVQVRHHAFRLMPGLEPQATVEVLASRYRQTPAQVRAMMAHVEEQAAGEGLQYQLARTQAGDTLDAHRLVKEAEAQGLGEQAVQHFYRAYFTDGRSLFERASLLALAAEVGIADAAAVLDSDRHADAVLADQQAVQQMGASGVPFFVIDGRLGVSGAQPPSAFLAALEQAAPAGQGEACGPDGCDV